MSNLNSVKCSKNIKQNLKTEKGVDISCDIVFNCTGLRPNTSLTKKIFGKTRYSLSLFDHFCPVKRNGEYFTKKWSEQKVLIIKVAGLYSTY